jgi:hypothetical protein
MENHHFLLMGKSTISMAMASIAFCKRLPEGNHPMNHPIMGFPRKKLE